MVHKYARLFCRCWPRPCRSVLIARPRTFSTSTLTSRTMHDYFMQQALAEAQRVLDEDEVPIGAVIVHGERIVAAAHNHASSCAIPPRMPK